MQTRSQTRRQRFAVDNCPSAQHFADDARRVQRDDDAREWNTTRARAGHARQPDHDGNGETFRYATDHLDKCTLKYAYVCRSKEIAEIEVGIDTPSAIQPIVQEYNKVLRHFKARFEQDIFEGEEPPAVYYELINFTKDLANGRLIDYDYKAWHQRIRKEMRGMLNFCNKVSDTNDYSADLIDRLREENDMLKTQIANKDDKSTHQSRVHTADQRIISELRTALRDCKRENETLREELESRKRRRVEEQQRLAEAAPNQEHYALEEAAYNSDASTVPLSPVREVSVKKEEIDIVSVKKE